MLKCYQACTFLQDDFFARQQDSCLVALLSHLVRPAVREFDTYPRLTTLPSTISLHRQMLNVNVSIM